MIKTKPKTTLYLQLDEEKIKKLDKSVKKIDRLIKVLKEAINLVYQLETDQGLKR